MQVVERGLGLNPHVARLGRLDFGMFAASVVERDDLAVVRAPLVRADAEHFAQIALQRDEEPAGGAQVDTGDDEPNETQPAGVEASAELEAVIAVGEGDGDSGENEGEESAEAEESAETAESAEGAEGEVSAEPTGPVETEETAETGEPCE